MLLLLINIVPTFRVFNYQYNNNNNLSNNAKM